jgi:hypothetical protein
VANKLDCRGEFWNTPSGNIYGPGELEVGKTKSINGGTVLSQEDADHLTARIAEVHPPEVETEEVPEEVEDDEDEYDDPDFTANVENRRVELNRQTVAELKDIAEEANVDLQGNEKKAQIVEKIIQTEFYSDEEE